VLITSWFDAAFIQPNGSGSFGPWTSSLTLSDFRPCT
jgi:hypothetical protein